MILIIDSDSVNINKYIKMLHLILSYDNFVQFGVDIGTRIPLLFQKLHHVIERLVFELSGDLFRFFLPDHGVDESLMNRLADKLQCHHAQDWKLVTN